MIHAEKGETAMCLLCIVESAARPVRASETEAICAVARQHAQVLEQALPASSVITPVLLGAIPEDGYTAAVEWSVQEDGVTHVLTARVPDAERYLKVTYELVDLTQTVNYTGNGPAGKSVIGRDALEAAMEHIDRVVVQMTALNAAVPSTTFADELDRVKLIKRCLVALGEHMK